MCTFKNKSIPVNYKLLGALNVIILIAVSSAQERYGIVMFNIPLDTL